MSTRIFTSHISKYRLMYCRYGNWKAKFNILSVGPLQCFSLTKGLCARNIRFCFTCQQYTDLFIFQFVSEHCLHSRLCLLMLKMLCKRQILALIYPYTLPALPHTHISYIYIYIYIYIYDKVLGVHLIRKRAQQCKNDGARTWLKS